MDDKFLGPKIVLPCPKNPDQSVKVLVISGVIKSGAGQLLAKIGYGPPVVKKQPTNVHI